jgi:uncharacterized protein with GYD domain
LECILKANALGDAGLLGWRDVGVWQRFRNKEVYMSKFLMQVSLTQDGVKGVAKDGGTKRRQAAEQFFKSVGGKLEAFYFAFGDTDVFAIVDFPDNVSAAAISLAGNGTGQANVKATVLITPEEMDEAAQKSQGLRPPGA